MTQRNQLTTMPMPSGLLLKRMLIGAAIALLLIIIFLVGGGPGKPEWGQLWIVKPLVVVPIAGAFGGALAGFTDPMRKMGGWQQVVANLITVILFIVVLWLGSVLGLNGTHWD